MRELVVCKWQKMFFLKGTVMQWFIHGNVYRELVSISYFHRAA